MTSSNENCPPPGNEELVAPLVLMNVMQPLLFPHYSSSEHFFTSSVLFLAFFVIEL